MSWSSEPRIGGCSEANLTYVPFPPGLRHTSQQLHQPDLHHGEHFREFAEESHREEGDEDLDGGSRRCRENNNPLQAQAGGNRHHHPHHWYVQSPDVWFAVHQRCMKLLF